MTQLKTFSDILSELSMKKDKQLPNLKIPVKGKKGTSKYMRMKINKVNAPYTSDYKKAMAASYDPSGVNEGPPGTEVMTPKSSAASAKSNKLFVKSRTKSISQMPAVKTPKQLVPGFAWPKPSTPGSRPINKIGLESVQTADKKAEKYVKPDGKVGVRMVKTDTEVIKKESIDNHPKVKAARKAHAAGTWDGNVDKEGEAVVHINGKPHTVTNKSKTNNLRKEAIKHTHAVVDPAGKVAGMTSNERDAKDIARRHKGKVMKLKRPMSPNKGDMMINRPFKEEVETVKEWAPLAVAALRTAPKIAGAVSRIAPSASLGAVASMAKDKVKSTADSLKKTYSNRKVMGVKSKQNEEMDPTDHVKKKDDKYCVYNKDGSVAKEFDNKKDADAYAIANHDKLMAEGKAYGPTGVSYYVPKGHKDEVDPKTKEKYPERQKPGYKAPSPKKEENDVDEALNMQQRMARKRLMKRYKSRIAIGKKRAAKKMANKKTLEKRATRQARNQLAKKLTRGIPKKELSFARKQEIEKRLDKPSMQTRIKRMARKMFKDVRKKEVERKKG